MDFFAFLPAILCGIIAVAFLNNGEKTEDDYAAKFWCYAFGIMFVFFTIYLANIGIEYSKPKYIHSVTNEYYDRNYW